LTKPNLSLPYYHDVLVAPNDTQLHISRGIGEEQIDYLIFYSNTDENVAKYTNDRERFRNRQSFERWLTKGRIVYTLSGINDVLLGICWFGEEKIPYRTFLLPIDPVLYQFTSALRVYNGMRRRGLSTPFFQRCHRDFMENPAFSQSDYKGFWAATSVDNIPAIKVLEKLGYSRVTNSNENNKILMVIDHQTLLQNV